MGKTLSDIMTQYNYQRLNLIKPWKQMIDYRQSIFELEQW